MDEELITKVFTPRLRDVNEVMYVSRPLLERQLYRSIRGSKHIAIFGESGNGKTWLLKHVLNDKNIPYISTNCGNASRLNSLTQEICNAIFGTHKITKTSYSEDKKVKVGFVAEAEISHTGNYTISSEEPLLEAFRTYYERTSNKQNRVIIIDNLESIYKSVELLDELADIILLLDDERYAKYKIKIIIVGLPIDILEYFSKTKASESISNRLSEISKVEGLSPENIKNIVHIGFTKQLGIKFQETDQIKLIKRIYDASMGVAQRIHEYCELLAYAIVDNDGVYKEKLLDEVEEQWLRDGLRHAYQVVESNMNSRNTEIARKNQVMFVIGKLSQHQFDASIIEKSIIGIFSETIPLSSMGVGKILSQLASSIKPLLKKNEQTNEYSVLDPKYIMCIRLVLYCDSNNKVQKKQFRR